MKAYAITEYDTGIITYFAEEHQADKWLAEKGGNHSFYRDNERDIK